jgi:hypothetical protein
MVFPQLERWKRGIPVCRRGGNNDQRGGGAWGG